MSNVKQQAQSEPTPEFNQRCMDVLRHWESGDLPFKEALAQLTTLSQKADAAGQPVNQGRAEQLLAYIQHYRGNLDESIYHNKRARALYNRAGNLRRVGIIDLNQGENYRFKGDFIHAQHLYQSAQRISEKLDDTSSLTLAIVNEGLTLLTMGDNAAAYRAFQKGLALAEQYPRDDDIQHQTYRRLMSEIRHGLAVIYLRENNVTGAWEEATSALKLAERTGDAILSGYAYRTIGEVLTALGEPPSGDYSADPDDYFRAALDSFRSLDAEAEIARTMYAQALSMATRGRRSNAARKLQHVMIMFERLGMVDDANRAAQAQRDVT